MQTWEVDAPSDAPNKNDDSKKWRTKYVWGVQCGTSFFHEPYVQSCSNAAVALVVFNGSQDVLCSSYFLPKLRNEKDTRAGLWLMASALLILSAIDGCA